MARILLKSAIVAALPTEIVPGDYARIADELGTKVSYVRDIASRIGLAPPRCRRLPEVEETIRLLRAGPSASDIARAAGVTSVAVYRQLNRAGYGLKAGTVFELHTPASAAGTRNPKPCLPRP